MAHADMRNDKAARLQALCRTWRSTYMRGKDYDEVLWQGFGDIMSPVLVMTKEPFGLRSQLALRELRRRVQIVKSFYTTHLLKCDLMDLKERRPDWASLSGFMTLEVRAQDPHVVLLCGSRAQGVYFAERGIDFQVYVKDGRMAVCLPALNEFRDRDYTQAVETIRQVLPPKRLRSTHGSRGMVSRLS